MTHAYPSLPAGYNLIETLDIQNNKRFALIINGLAVVLSLALLGLGWLIRPLAEFSGDEITLNIGLTDLIVTVVGTAAYFILHELTHGAAMKLFGTKKVKYGFTSMYLFAGSDDYYDKPAYITIALAPIVVWGIVLLILNLALPIEWFWSVYIIQMLNISGAAGDLYITFRFAPLPNDTLFRDEGTKVEVYGK